MYLQKFPKLCNWTENIMKNGGSYVLSTKLPKELQNKTISIYAPALFSYYSLLYTTL